MTPFITSRVTKYDRPVSLGPLAPQCRTPVLSYSLTVTPETHFINWQQDPPSNYLARLVFPEKTTEFAIEVDLVAEMSVYNPFDFFLEPQAENFPFRYDPVLSHELEPFQRKLPLTPKSGEYLRGIHERLKIPHLPSVHSEVATDVHAHGHLPDGGWRAQAGGERQSPAHHRLSGGRESEPVGGHSLSGAEELWVRG